MHATCLYNQEFSPPNTEEQDTRQYRGSGCPHALSQSQPAPLPDGCRGVQEYERHERQMIALVPEDNYVHTAYKDNHCDQK